LPSEPALSAAKGRGWHAFLQIPIAPDSYRDGTWYFSQKAVTPKALTEAQQASGVRTVSEPEISQGAGFKLLADARFAQRSGAKVGVWVQRPLRICHESRSKSKKCDNCASRSLGEGWTTYP